MCVFHLPSPPRNVFPLDFLSEPSSLRKIQSTCGHQFVRNGRTITYPQTGRGRPCSLLPPARRDAHSSESRHCLSAEAGGRSHRCPSDTISSFWQTELTTAASIRLSSATHTAPLQPGLPARSPTQQLDTSDQRSMELCRLRENEAKSIRAKMLPLPPALNTPIHISLKPLQRKLGLGWGRETTLNISVNLSAQMTGTPSLSHPQANKEHWAALGGAARLSATL